jgi:hypothetical protein
MGGGGGSISGSPQYSNVDRLDFSNDTVTASARSPLSIARWQVASVGNVNYGWFSGGYVPPSTFYSTVDRIDFSNDLSNTSPRGLLPSGIRTSSGLSTNNFGWLVGGYVPGNATQSTVSRIDFSNDLATSSVRGLLTAVKDGAGTAGNANYGWAAGGSPANSIVNRIDYSNDLAQASSRGVIPTATYHITGAGNTNYGWFAGGGFPSALSSVSRIDYSNDTSAASVRGVLTVARYGMSGTSNANYGWFNGGYSSTAPAGVRSITDRIDFSNDSPTSASPRGIATAARHQASGTSNYVKTVPSLQYPTQGMNTNQSTAGYGWFGGGYNPAPAFVSTVDRIDFSNDSPTSASPRGQLSYTASQLSAVSNANYGWWIAGYGSDVLAKSLVSRIDFANDSPTTASPRGPVSLARRNVGVAGNSNYGWVAGGFAPPTTFTSIIDRVDYSNDLFIAVQRGPLSAGKAAPSGTANANYGWFAGGGNPAVPGAVSVIERVDFSNDSPTTASPRGPLTSARYALAATGNANYGWFGGGQTPTAVSIVDRIDYSNDSPTSASPRGQLSGVRFNFAAAGNANYGWWAGGQTPTAVSSVNRIDYSNDSPTAASPRGVLSVERYVHGGTSNYVRPSLGQQTISEPFYGNASSGGQGGYAWAVAGNTAVTVNISSTERIDFSNDLAATSPRGPLRSARYAVTASGNANYGWYGGGSGSSYVSTVDRIDYSNDLTDTSFRGPLNSARYRAGSTGNTNYGWWAGGFSPSAPIYKSSVDRIDYSNDLNAASLRSPLNNSRMTSAVGNNNYGWSVGKNASFLTIVERIDYSNDTNSPTPRGNLTASGYNQGAAGNTNYGWFSGAPTPAPSSLFQRIDYSNDTATPTTRAIWLNQAYEQGASGNDSYGWWIGGQPSTNNIPFYSYVARLDYSNDLTTPNPRGPLTTGRGSPGSSSNYVKSPIRTNITQYYKGSSTVGTQGPSIDSLSPTTAYTFTSVGTYGWFVGGGPPPIPSGQSSYSVVDRIDFSNDSPTTASPRGALATIYSAGTNNTSYGWFSTTLSGALNRIDFNNDTAAASTRGSLSNARYLLGAVSNANYGWYGGGVTPGNIMYTTVDRIDFSNDSPTTAGVRGPLSLVRQTLAAVGNASYGWFGGGYTTPGATSTSFVDRIDYSNDSPASAIPRGPLSSARPWLSAVGNANYGWFAGGGAGVSRIDRIDYSNDAASAAVRGPLSVSRTFNQGAAGNTNYGWFSGGAYFGTPSPTQYSTVNRIDFSNDSPTAASPRGPLSLARSNVGAASNYVK